MLFRSALPRRDCVLLGLCGASAEGGACSREARGPWCRVAGPREATDPRHRGRRQERLGRLCRCRRFATGAAAPLQLAAVRYPARRPTPVGAPTRTAGPGRVARTGRQDRPRAQRRAAFRNRRPGPTGVRRGRHLPACGIPAPPTARPRMPPRTSRRLLLPLPGGRPSPSSCSSSSHCSPLQCSASTRL